MPPVRQKPQKVNYGPWIWLQLSPMGFQWLNFVQLLEPQGVLPPSGARNILWRGSGEPSLGNLPKAAFYPTEFEAHSNSEPHFSQTAMYLTKC